ncbi:MAG: hypothetical protein RL291_2051, partial [Pseudomonadota bacterium]
HRAEAGNITLAVDMTEPDAVIVADDMRVRQVLFNLLSNAIGFSPKGGTVNLSAKMTETDAELTVSDRGVGIPPGLQERMFERFESRSQGSNHRGAGLGLAIVRSLVALHGGSITVDSEPGAGTTISVCLPREDLHLPRALPRVVTSGEQLALPFYAEAG